MIRNHLDSSIPVLIRNPSSMLATQFSQSIARGCLLAVVVSCGFTGCQRMRAPGNFPPPPGLISTKGATVPNDPANQTQTTTATLNGKPTGTLANAVSYSQEIATAARPSDDASVPMIVRGQNTGGFVIPPLPQVTADGGRHTRDPMPVGAQQASTQPAATVAQTTQFGELPAPPAVPSTNPSADTTPPSFAVPYGNAAAPNTYTPAQPFVPSQPYTAAQPGYGAQPGYDLLPQISADDLTLDPAQTVGIPYEPPVRIADIFVNGYPARTGRIMFGGAVNSDAGVTGQITIEERNFDITRFPTSFQDFVSGTAFRGAGQTLRIEAVPGSQFKRYSINFSEPFMFGFMPISMSVSAFLFDRRYQDWDEERLGGRLNFGYRVTPDLSLSAGIRGEQVEVSRPRVGTVQELNDVLGENEIYSAQARITHDTRNSPFAPSEGHFLELTYEQAFGDFEFPRFEASYNKYFLVRERADRSGRQTLTTGFNVGVSGEETPIFENFFAGGYTTLRGFEFRGASPTTDGVQVGGRFQMLGTVEYMFPITADDMLRAVAFVDYGTVEQNVELNGENFRVSPGFGLRIAVPALGPAPLAFDFAFPVEDAAGDQRQTFSFYMGLNRKI